MNQTSQGSSVIPRAWQRVAIAAFALIAHDVTAQETASAQRQSLDDAWWTGPIVAAGAGTMPQGHVLIEPYVYDVIRTKRFDANDDRQSAPFASNLFVQITS